MPLLHAARALRAGWLMAEGRRNGRPVVRGEWPRREGRPESAAPGVQQACPFRVKGTLDPAISFMVVR